MTSEAQPGQEQRMVTDAMIRAGVNAFDRTQTLSVHKLLEVAYPAMHEARPTADLGDDARWLEIANAIRKRPPEKITAAEAFIPGMADRLILYREALGPLLDMVDELYRKYGVGLDAHDVAIAQGARAVLLRSGG